MIVDLAPRQQQLEQRLRELNQLISQHSMTLQQTQVALEQTKLEAAKTVGALQLVMDLQREDGEGPPPMPFPK